MKPLSQVCLFLFMNPVFTHRYSLFILRVTDASVTSKHECCLLVTSLLSAVWVLVQFSWSETFEHGIWKRQVTLFKLTSPLMTLETAWSMFSFVYFRPGPFLLYIRDILNASTKQCHIVIRNNLLVASRENCIPNREQ